MKQKYIDYYMDVAFRTSQMSDATRLKVGAIFVRDNDILSYGWNGQPIGYHTNVCEHWDETKNELITDDTVVHAEMNALVHLTRKGLSSIGSIVFLTHSPCWNCSKHLVQSGVDEVYYRNSYRMLGEELIEFYDKMNVKLIRV